MTVIFEELVRANFRCGRMFMPSDSVVFGVGVLRSF